MIVMKTLQILNDLSIGYSSVRKLVQLDEIQFILNNHTVSGIKFAKEKLIFFLIAGTFSIFEQFI